jgi:hypothetical protein
MSRSGTGGETSPWVVRRWFAKVAYRIIDEQLVKNLSSELFRPFNITFEFELNGDRANFTFPVATVPVSPDIFKFWVEPLAQRALGVLRQKIDRRFFNSNARLFLSVDGVA